MTKDEAIKQAKILVTVLLTDDVITKQEAEILRQALDQFPDTTKMIDTGIDRGLWDDVPDATKWVDELRGDDETTYSDIQLAEMIMSDCGIGSEVTSLRDRIAKRITKHREAKHQALEQPEREWFGLTDEEGICDEWERITGHNIDFEPKSEGRAMYLSADEVIEFARAIEAKLKEKNSV